MKSKSNTANVKVEASFNQGRGDEIKLSGRRHRLPMEAKGGKLRKAEAARIKRGRKVARDARALEGMSRGLANKRALRQAAFSGVDLERSTIEEMEGIYHALIVAAYAATGGFIPDLAQLFRRRKSVLRVVVSPALRVGGLGAQALLAAADEWEAVQAAREAAGDARARGKKAKVVLSIAAERQNPYPLRVRLAWARALWRGARGCVAESYRGNRDKARVASIDDLRGLQARFGDAEAAAAESEDLARVALLREQTTARAVEGYGDADRGARRVDVRRHVAHARRCLLAFHLIEGGRKCMSDVLNDLGRLAKLARVVRGESFALLGDWSGCFNSSGKKKEFERFRKRLGAGDVILSGVQWDRAETAIAAFEAVRAGGRKAGVRTWIIDGNGNVCADKLSVETAAGRAFVPSPLIVRGSGQTEKAKAARMAKRRAVAIGGAPLVVESDAPATVSHFRHGRGGRVYLSSDSGAVMPFKRAAVARKARKESKAQAAARAARFAQARAVGLALGIVKK